MIITECPCCYGKKFLLVHDGESDPHQHACMHCEGKGTVECELAEVVSLMEKTWSDIWAGFFKKWRT